MEDPNPPAVEIPILSDRKEAEIIERIIRKQRRKNAAENSEEVESEAPSTSSLANHGYKKRRNHEGLEKRQSLFYYDPFTRRSFRFLLHRKNSRKADIYTCARCKSRRKYVRIMVRNDKFLGDPAALDHICHMNAAELQEERVRMEERKQRKRNRFLLCDNDDGLFEGDLNSNNGCDSVISDDGCILSSTPNSPKSLANEDGSRLDSLDDLELEADSTSEKGPSSSSAAPTPGSSRVVMAGVVKEEQQQPVYYPSKEESHSVLSTQPTDDYHLMTSAVKDESQTSEQEPSDPHSNSLIRDAVFLESIKMAVDSIPQANRQKAYVDILRHAKAEKKQKVDEIKWVKLWVSADRSAIGYALKFKCSRSVQSSRDRASTRVNALLQQLQHRSCVEDAPQLGIDQRQPACVSGEIGGYTLNNCAIWY